VYQSCSAPAVYPETCNGRDDNCDGLVDNGVGQLDCAAGNVCFQGKCQPVQDLTEVSASLASQGARLALQGGRAGHGALPVLEEWDSAARHRAAGSQALGTSGTSLPTTHGTSALLWRTTARGDVWTRYFVKSFPLTAAEASSTFGYTVPVRRVHGVVVYLNGAELFRSNMPAGAITHQTLSSSYLGLPERQR